MAVYETWAFIRDLALGASLGVKPHKALFCSGPQALLACHPHDVGWSLLSNGGQNGHNYLQYTHKPPKRTQPLAQTLAAVRTPTVAGVPPTIKAEHTTSPHLP